MMLNCFTINNLHGFMMHSVMLLYVAFRMKIISNFQMLAAVQLLSFSQSCLM